MMTATQPKVSWCAHRPLSRLRWRQLDYRRFRSQTEPVDYRPVDQQPHSRYRPQMRQKMAVADARHRSDQHILWIAGNPCRSADVGGRRKCQQIRKWTHTHALSDLQNQRSHEQADHVIHEKCRQNAAGEDHSREQLARREVKNHVVRYPVEKAGQV